MNEDNFTYNSAWLDGAKYALRDITNTLAQYRKNPNGWTAEDLARALDGRIDK